MTAHDDTAARPRVDGARPHDARSPAADPADPTAGPTAGPVAGPVAPTAGLGMALLGGTAALSMAVVLVLGLAVTKPDIVMGEAVRLLYIHPAIAWTTYTAVATALAAGLLWLWPRARRDALDHYVGAATELATLFSALSLVSGAIWGRTTWGVWLRFDPRITSTAVELVLLLGVLGLRSIPSTSAARVRRSTVALVVVAANIPIIHFSVQWWRGLHQTASVLKQNPLHPELRNLQLITLLLSFVAFTLLFAWLLVARARSLRLAEAAADGGLDVAISARRAEAGRYSRVSAEGARVSVGSAAP